MQTQSEITSDNDLAVLSKSDTAAFGELYEKYFPKLYAFVQYKYYSTREELEDIASEIFGKVLRNLARFDPDKGNFSSWFFTIAQNYVKDLYKKKMSKNVSLDSVENMLFDNSQIQQIQRSLEKSEQRSMLSKVLSMLPDREQEIIALKFGSEYTYDEISEILGITPENARIIAFRAIKKLRDLIKRIK